ncbi:MAG: hypothetical protein ACYDG2_23870 [Ruminiclostridium sp.]
MLTENAGIQDRLAWKHSSSNGQKWQLHIHNLRCSKQTRAKEAST